MDSESIAEPEWTRLSESQIWEWQRQYFEGKGIQAWSAGEVPQYITSNAYIAAAYSRIVLGWTDALRAGSLDKDQPVYILELGAGSGRFAYKMLRRLSQSPV